MCDNSRVDIRHKIIDLDIKIANLSEKYEILVSEGGSYINNTLGKGSIPRCYFDSNIHRYRDFLINLAREIDEYTSERAKLISMSFQ